MSPTVSDHKPVASLFKVKYKTVDPVQQKLVTISILDYLKNLAENFVPKLRLSAEAVVFCNVSYGDERSETLEIENAGDGLLEFDVAAGRHAWLKVEPSKGVVKAGERASITVKLSIGQREAQQIFLNRELTETITISTNEPET